MLLTQLLEKLKIRDQGLNYESEAIHLEAEAFDRNDTPMAIRAISGVGAWLSAILLVVFLYTIKLINESYFRLFFGALSFVISIIFSKQTLKKPFLDALIVAAGIIGQILFYSGIAEIFKHEQTATYFVGVIVEPILIYFTYNLLQRYVNTAAWVSFVYFLFQELKLNSLSCLSLGIFISIWTLMWMKEIQFYKNKKFVTIFYPFGYGILTAAILLMITMSWYAWSGMRHSAWDLWLLSGIIIINILYVVYKACLHFGFKNWWLLLLLLAIVLIPAIYTPGISIGLLALVIGLYRGERLLTGIGIAVMIFFIGKFYYMMHTTFLTKSLLLMGSGLIILVGYIFFKKLVKINEQNQDTLLH